MLDPEAIKRLEDWGGPTLARKMVRLFLDTSHERVDQVRKGLSGDLAVAERGAHSLKSSAGNLGATRLQDLAAAMEGHLSKSDARAASDMLPALEDAHRRTLEALHDLENELS